MHTRGHVRSSRVILCWDPYHVVTFCFFLADDLQLPSDVHFRTFQIASRCAVSDSVLIECVQIARTRLAVNMASVAHQPPFSLYLCMQTPQPRPLWIWRVVTGVQTVSVVKLIENVRACGWRCLCTWRNGL